MYQLLTAKAISKGFGHLSRWVLIPLIVLAVIACGLFFVSDDAVSVTLRSNIASFVNLFVAVTATWLCSRWLDWLQGVSFKHDILPQIRAGNLPLAIYYTGRWVGLCILIGTVLATVRF